MRDRGGIGGGMRHGRAARPAWARPEVGDTPDRWAPPVGVHVREGGGGVWAGWAGSAAGEGKDVGPKTAQRL
jgi:hypothetical protein